MGIWETKYIVSIDQFLIGRGGNGGHHLLHDKSIHDPSEKKVTSD